VPNLSDILGHLRTIETATPSESHAERLEWEAGVAIDYAIASVEQAKLAVLDAISSRVQAEKMKESHPAS
jgi:hypothetical protein